MKTFAASTDLHLSAFLLLLFLAAACANPIPPEGGARDRQPPQLVTENSTPNYQTNFEKQTIVLTFDEWVELKDVFSQVVISPPLDNPYDLRIKKRSVLFEFAEEEVLREDATYTINFGDAVQDITESNPAEDLRFVFATGDELDSLQLSGKLLDAQTGEPVEGALFMLYDNLADSVVRTIRPFYFAKTGEDGQFQINNIKADTFKGFALIDANLNYLYDQSNEMIGFPDSLVAISGEEAPPTVGLRMFQEKLDLVLRDSQTRSYARVKLTFNREPFDLEITPGDDAPPLIYEAMGDSLRLWYAEAPRDSFRLFLRQDTVYSDTITVRPASRQAFLEGAGLRLSRQQPTSRAIPPNGRIRLRFNHPLRGIDTSRIRFSVDTTRRRADYQFSIDSSEARRILQLRTSWQAGKPYFLELLPEAVTDIFGLTNLDTLRQDYRVTPAEELGNILLTLNGLDSTRQYVVELLSQEDQLLDSERVRDVASWNNTYRLLSPGNYRVRVVEDLNRNGRWDSGNYQERRQPEPIFINDLQRLRANWELESEIKLRESFGEEAPNLESGG